MVFFRVNFVGSAGAPPQTLGGLSAKQLHHHCAHSADGLTCTPRAGELQGIETQHPRSFSVERILGR